MTNRASRVKLRDMGNIRADSCLALPVIRELAAEDARDPCDDTQQAIVAHACAMARLVLT